ncbi:hypothetical protein [Stagnihabitans tardus]|uniref:Tetratricopeptide repeat protein n=1 Tax=Stagnihabitans tardus TaxID=2699202 RepID=A0AAE5BXG4_9RHOB|nr:hypothetical protein [Stagnihabitans tardus]NBZ89313.1 hypothetical protein [Stagnihabitans tardus]
MKHTLFALLLSALPLAARAEVPDCLPSPSRACLFQMALTQAEAADRPVRLARGYLAVAIAQESIGSDADPTRRALLVGLLRRNPDPAEARENLGWAMFGLVLSDTHMENSPQTLRWFHQTMRDLDRQANLPETKDDDEARREKTRAKVAAAPKDHLPKYARADALGLTVDIELGQYWPPFSFAFNPGRADTLSELIRHRALTAAATEIVTLPSTAMRANGRAFLALGLAKAGKLPEAQALASSLDLSLMDEEGLIYLAEVQARVGQEKAATDLLDSIPRTSGYVRSNTDNRLRLAIIARTVSGDFKGARDLILVLAPRDRGNALNEALDARLTAGRQGLAPLLASLPSELRARALYYLGWRQASLGDLKAAQLAQALLQAMGPVAQDYDLRPALAPLLAALGKTEDATRMAHDLGNAIVTAQVAAHLKEKGRPQGTAFPADRNP